ncbi:MAG: RbsD/FucU domain-containing protein, partial [Faecalispora jeddahensis]
MKKTGILNAQLAGYIAGLGHKERFLIGDAGMPVPKGIPVVDLVLCGGIPTFQQVVDAVLNETV